MAPASDGRGPPGDGAAPPGDGAATPGRLREWKALFGKR